MSTRRHMQFAVAMLVAVVFAAIGTSAQPRQTDERPPATVAYGHDLFMYYCASCHGRDARGNGPAAPSLKISPPDLTLMTKRYGGVFPATAIAALLSEGDRQWLPSHGSKEMPVWGPILRRTGGQDAATEVRVDSLVSYLRTVQVQ